MSEDNRSISHIRELDEERPGYLPEVTQPEGGTAGTQLAFLTLRAPESFH